VRVDLGEKHRVHARHEEVACRGHRTLGGSITILVVLEQRELKGTLKGVQHRWVTFVEGVVHEEVLICDGLG